MSSKIVFNTSGLEFYKKGDESNLNNCKLKIDENGNIGFNTTDISNNPFNIDGILKTDTILNNNNNINIFSISSNDTAWTHNDGKIHTTNNVGIGTLNFSETFKLEIQNENETETEDDVIFKVTNGNIKFQESNGNYWIIKDHFIQHKDQESSSVNGIYLGRHIGVNDPDPYLPLVVRGYIQSWNTNEGGTVRYREWGHTTKSSGGALPYAYMHVGGHDKNRSSFESSWNSWRMTLWCQYGMISYRSMIASDERIKTEIVNVSKEYALDLVRKIPCREYHYKDLVRKQKEKTVGFIAQEVKKHYPIAVQLQKDFIPDKQQIAEGVTWEETEDNKYLLSITNYEVEVGTKVKFICSNNNDTDELIKEEEYISTKRDDNKYLFENKYNMVFIYGKMVEDLNIVNKEKIYALHHPAIQEIDRIQHDIKDKIEIILSNNINKIDNDYMEMITNLKNNKFSENINELESQYTNILNNL